MGAIKYFIFLLDIVILKINNFYKNSLTSFDIVGYDSSLNGYSLIPSWWRDRPNETQQPAFEDDNLTFSSSKGAKPEARHLS
jgi:hypothetical protein